MARNGKKKLMFHRIMESLKLRDFIAVTLTVWQWGKYTRRLAVDVIVHSSAL